MKAIVALILFFTLVRLINLTIIPIFSDEALYLSLSNNFAHNPSTALNSLNFGVMPITIWIDVPFQLLFPANYQLWIGRFLSVFSDGLSAYSHIHTGSASLVSANT